MSPNDALLYADHISSLNNGHALWNPHPGYVMNQEGDLTRMCPPVRPGDIGCIEEDGSFTRFFNIHLPEDDINQGGGPYPENFEPLTLDPSRITWRPEPPRTYRSHKRLNVWAGISGGGVLPVPVGGGTSFTFQRTAGAILGFFDTGSCEDSHKFPYKLHLVKNRSRWLDAIQTVKPGSRTFQLVTGCTSVRSWVTGVIENEKVNGDIKLSVGFTPDSTVNLQVSSGVQWENLGSSTTRHGPPERLELIQALGLESSENAIITNHGTPVGSQTSPADVNKIKDWSDQCIFIRSLHIKQRIGFGFPIKLKGAAEPQDPKKDGKHEGDRLLRNIRHEAENLEEEGGGQNGTPYDHMDAALEYILNNSNADIAVVHEEDLWAYVEASIFSEWGLTAYEVLQSYHPKVFVQEEKGIIIGFFNAEADQQPQETMPMFAYDYNVINTTEEQDASSNPTFSSEPPKYPGEPSGVFTSDSKGFSINPGTFTHIPPNYVGGSKNIKHSNSAKDGPREKKIQSVSIKLIVVNDYPGRGRQKESGSLFDLPSSRPSTSSHLSETASSIKERLL
ncbi:hypothetical protein GG344DRAFT_73304 [Lentinula edodes]|nr:hypothetical protein GG344DRAFT_73304 [Lentinula edodes]